MIIGTILVSPSNFQKFVVRVYDSLTVFAYLCFIHTGVRSVACDRGPGAELACDFRWDLFRVGWSFVKKKICKYKVQRSIPTLRGLCWHARLVRSESSFCRFCELHATEATEAIFVSFLVWREDHLKGAQLRDSSRMCESWEASWVVWGISLTRNDLFWQGFLNHELLEVFCWPETTCLGRGFWIMSCLRYFVDQKRPSLARMFESWVAWGFLSWDDLRDFWIMSCLRFFVDQKRPALAGMFVSCVAWGFLSWNDLRTFESCVAWGISLTRNDRHWQGFLNHLLLEVFCWPWTTCLGRDVWIMSCLEFSLTRNDLP